MLNYIRKKELNKLSATLSIMRDYCYNYFSYVFLSSESNNIQIEIEHSLDIYNQSNDVDLCCSIIHDIPQNIIKLWDQFKYDLNTYIQNSIYLLYPIDYLLFFIEGNHMTSLENISEFKNNRETLHKRYNTLIEECISDINDVADIRKLCDLLTQYFPTYRSAKRGNPILRTISQIVGGALGGYLSASISDNVGDWLDFGTLLGESCESVVDTFTSGTRQDKISSYESLLNDTLTCARMPIKELTSELDDIRSDFNDLIIELHDIIINNVICHKLKRKEIINMRIAINYINSFPQGFSKYFRKSNGVLKYIKDNNYLTKKEYKQLLKLL